MPRVTRSNINKAKLLYNSEISEDQPSKRVKVPAEEEDVKLAEETSECDRDASSETDKDEAEDSKLAKKSGDNDRDASSESDEDESSDSEYDKLAENLSDRDASSETDEDEAPESIPLSVSKEAAVAEIRKVKETVDALKEREKQRRRERNEILIRQKEFRKTRELSRLPADILEKVAHNQVTVAEQKKEIKGAKAIAPVTLESDDKKEIVTQDSVIEEPKGLQVVVLSQASKNKKKVLDSATNFLQSHFYGDRLKRVETLKDENQRRKRKKLESGILFTKNAY